MINIEEDRLNELFDNINLDCSFCPLKNKQYRCAYNVGCLNPIPCVKILKEWLSGKDFSKYWNDPAYIERINKNE